MKFTTERDALAKALTTLEIVIEKRSKTPILLNIKIEAAEGRLTLTGTDLNMAIVKEIPADIEQEGATTVPARGLRDIVRGLAKGSKIDMELCNKGLTLGSGNLCFTLACLPPEDFPAMNPGNLPHRFRLSAKDIAHLVDRTRFAISTEKTRYYLNGIYLHVADGGEGGAPVLRAVATDGHRLAKYDLVLPKGAAGMPGIIVPRKTVLALRNAIGKYAGEVEVALSDTQIRLGFGDTVVVSWSIQATFPDYSRAIPTGNDRILKVPAGNFKIALKNILPISTDKSNPLKLALDKDCMTLSVTNREGGSVAMSMPVKYSASVMDIGFSPRYLLDILDRIEGDDVEIRLKDPESPTPVFDPADAAALYLVMPMRL